MGAITNAIPEISVAVGKALFMEHKDSIKRVVAASNATAAELKNPDKLKEYFGIDDADSAWEKTFKYKDFEKKTKIPLKAPSLEKLKMQAMAGEFWLRQVATFNPEILLEKERKRLNKKMQAYLGFVSAYGERDPRTMKEAKRIVKDFVAYRDEATQMYQWLSVSKKWFPIYSKVYTSYLNIFDNGRTVFEKIIKVVPHPDVQAPAFTFHLFCNSMYGICNGSAAASEAAGKMAKKYEKIAQGHQLLGDMWVERLMKPTISKKVEEAAMGAKKVTSALKKHFGLS